MAALARRYSGYRTKTKARKRPTARGVSKKAFAIIKNQNTKLRANVRAGRQQLNAKGGDVKTSFVVVSGGALSGVLDAKLPTIAGVDSRVIVGSLLCAAGIWGVKGKKGGLLCLAGAGVLAAGASETVSGVLGAVSDGDD